MLGIIEKMSEFKAKRKAASLMGQKYLFSDGVERVCNIVAILHNEETGRHQFIPGANIVTNDGDRWYAVRGANEADYFTIAGMRLGSSITAPTKADTDVSVFIASTGKAIDATYPTTSDPDADNTGSGVDIVTFRTSYTAADFAANGIQELAIVDSITLPTKALTHALFAASFNKTASDTLKVFINHTMNGV